MPKRTGRPWQRRKRQVIRRDRGICHICGQPGADSADHIVPHAHGGTDRLDNLAAVHHDEPPRCNRRRGTSSVNETRRRLDLGDGADLGAGWDW